MLFVEFIRDILDQIEDIAAGFWSLCGKKKKATQFIIQQNTEFRVTANYDVVLLCVETANQTSGSR